MVHQFYNTFQGFLHRDIPVEFQFIRIPLKNPQYRFMVLIDKPFNALPVEALDSPGGCSAHITDRVIKVIQDTHNRIPGDCQLFKMHFMITKHF
jgi:hypothetical protein